MSLVFGKKAGLISLATALGAGLAVCVDSASIAATASSTVRMQVLPSIKSMTDAQNSAPEELGKTCEYKFLSFYMGRNDGSELTSKTSAQCSSAYEIPAEDGWVIILP